MVQAAMRNPWIVISFRKAPVKIPRFVSLGGLFKSPSSGGSMPIARAGEDPGSSILVRKGNDDLIEELNQILSKVMEDGTLQKWEDDAIALMDKDSLND